MVAGVDKKIYIVGGMSFIFGNDPTRNVIAVDPTTGAIEYPGQLAHTSDKGFLFDFPTLRCCVMSTGDLLVCGAPDGKKHTTLQLFSPSLRTVTSTVSLGLNLAEIYGIVLTGTHILVVAYNDTVVCPVANVTSWQKEKSMSVTRCDKYRSPNEGCAVMLKGDTHIVLIGGQRRSNFHFPLPGSYFKRPTVYHRGRVAVSGGTVCTGTLLHQWVLCYLMLPCFTIKRGRIGIIRRFVYLGLKYKNMAFY